MILFVILLRYYTTTSLYYHVIILPRRYNFATLTTNLPLVSVVAEHVPVRVNDTFVVAFVLNLSAATPPDIFVSVVLMITAVPVLLNNN